MAVPVTEFVINEPQLTNLRMQHIGPQLDHLAEKAGGGTLRLDFARVEHLTSMVLGKLVSLNKRMRNAGGALQIVNLSSELYELFAITRLTTVLDVRAKAASGVDGSLAAQSA